MKSPFGGKSKKKLLVIVVGIIIFVNLGLFLFFRSRNQTRLAPAPSDRRPINDKPLIQQDDLPPVDQSATTQDIPSSTDQPAVQDLPPVDQPSTQKSDFSIGGVLIDDGNPWTLIYDDAATGSPASTLELVFTDQSRCDFGQGDASCTPMYYEVGTGIEVTGQKDGSQLIVSRIERSVPRMPQ